MTGMKRRVGWMVLGVGLMAAGCNEAREPITVESNVSISFDSDPDGNEADPAIANATATAPDFAGRWIGPEGMFLDIAADPEVGPGHYTIRNRWGLDTEMEGAFKGTVEAGVLRFTRPDGDQTLTPGSGEATGMKYLLDKSDCLIVRTGEGYCRA